MSSKVLSGDASHSAEQIIWKHLDPAPNHAMSPETEHHAGGANPEGAEALHARIAELEREMPLREQKALRAGMEKGRVAGEQEAAARLNAVIERFAATVSDLAARRRRMRREAESDVVKLSIAIARRVLHRELNADPEAMLGLVKAALDKLDGREVDRIRVHPADAEAVRAHVGRLRPTGQFEIVPDSRLERGAAVFETARGTLDGSVETQLQEIERGLIDKLRS
jgi:flagellar assembly protein FliH